MTKPLLYLSLFLKRHRDDYYRRLTAVRVDGDWEAWIDCFLEGVATVADEAVASARELFALVAEDRARLLAREGTSVAARRLFELLPRHPVITVASAVTLLETTKPTAGRAIELLGEAGSSWRRPARGAIGRSCIRSTWPGSAWGRSWDGGGEHSAAGSRADGHGRPDRSTPCCVGDDRDRSDRGRAGGVGAGP